MCRREERDRSKEADLTTLAHPRQEWKYFKLGAYQWISQCDGSLNAFMASTRD